MTCLEKLAKLLLAVTSERGLPVHYHSDIAEDIRIINNSQADEFVWLLRSHGSCILPLYVGASPIHIEYFMDASMENPTYRIGFVDGEPVVTPVPHSEVRKLIYQPPALNQLEPAWDQVKDALERGVQGRWWGIFHVPASVEDFTGLKGWLKYFQEAKNQPMVDYLVGAAALHEKQRQLGGVA